MALDVMDKLVARPISIAVARPTDQRNSTLSGIRANLLDRNYQDLESWQKDVVSCISNCRESHRMHVDDICDELAQTFERLYSRLKEFSEFRFRDACERVYGDLLAAEAEL
jgi:hypothetical protein